MEKNVSYIMNTVANTETINEFMNIVSDADYAQFCSTLDDGRFFFFELNLALLKENNEYVKSLTSEEYSEFDMDKFAEDYINGVPECVELFNDDKNWNFTTIEFGEDKINNTKYLGRLAVCLSCPGDVKDMIENDDIETLRYLAAKELFYRWLDGEDIED